MPPIKKEYPYVLLWLALLWLHPPAPAVSQSRSEANALAKKGVRYFRRENYPQALDHFNRALAADSGNVRALYYGGITNQLLFSNQTAIDYLLRSYALKPKFDKHYQYWLGRAYHVNLQFDRAIAAYRAYLEAISPRDSRQNSVKVLILQATVGKTYLVNPTDHYAEPLGENVNSPFTEHTPVLTTDRQTMYFTSRRPVDPNDLTYRGDGWERIYVSSLQNGQWTPPEPLPGRVNSDNEHTSNVQLYDRDDRMIVYKSVKFGSLFVTEKEGGSWSAPRELADFTNTARFEPNGFLLRGGNLVYFASGRGNKNGNLDLFVARRRPNGQWGEPQRLPDIINTDADEDAPFLTEDGNTLYFSSRGHDSMGGYDVYKSMYEPLSRSWTRPLNMGYPINTPGDDVYFVTDSLNKISYVASNRKGTSGQEDLFRIKMFEDVLVKGVVTIKGTDRPLPNYALLFDSQRRVTVKGSSYSSPTGTYGLQLRSGHTYTVEIRGPNGQTVHTDQLEIPLLRVENSEIVRNFQVDIPDTLSAGAADRLVVKNLNLVKIRYQEQDSLIINGEVVDNAGVIEGASVRLREENARDYLSQAVTDVDGTYRFSFVPGKKTDYVVEIDKPGYLLYSVAVLHNETPNRFTNEEEINATRFNRIDVRSVLTGFLNNNLGVGSTAVLGGVYFEFNSANLLPESNVVLDKLFDFLRSNPRVVMEIGGHTDNVGPAYVNKFLSQKRAQAVVNYLLQKGIPRARLTAMGYGETRPITTNDLELNGRDVNRRVEVKILKR
jgi:outer membrane protein OmpA-like peptidoglycan-associated protein